MLKTDGLQYHINCCPGDVGGYCILPGDPGRVPKIAAYLDDAELIAEMEQSFKPEYVVFFPDYLEVTFPESALPAYGVSSGMGIDFTKNEELQKLLQPWAVPNKEEKE